MKSKIKIISAVILSFLLINNLAHASFSDGSIDLSYRYAWGENVGFIDFGSSIGDVHIRDNNLSGYAYGENIGWVNLSTVTNNNGILGGYAWGENVGFIDFSKVSIGNDGIFSGYAYGENIGWITFGTLNNKVVTDWRPNSVRPPSSSGSYSSGSSSYFSPKIVPIKKQIEEIEVSKNIENIAKKEPSLLIKQITRTLKQTIKETPAEDVKYLQLYLNSKGYNCGIADGKFGNKTKKAIILFQKSNNLKADGIVGPATRAKLINN